MAQKSNGHHLKKTSAKQSTTNKMIRIIVRKYQAAFLFSILIVIMGTMAYVSIPRESAPEIKRPIIFVTTTYPGVPAADIETLITQEIEEEIDGLDDLIKVTSTSSQGVSSIAAEFDSDVAVEIALRRVRERVDIAKTEMPPDVDEPVVRELNFSDQPILIIVLSNPSGLDVLGQSVDDMEEMIEKIPGVLDVKITGKLEKEVAIELNPLKMKNYGISLEDVINSVRSENVTIPGGVLKSTVKQYDIAVSGEIKNPDQFGKLIVNADGVHHRLNTLANVHFGYKEPETVSRINGQPCVTISITKQSGENLIKIVDEIKRRIDAYRDRLPNATKITYSYDKSKNIRDMVYDLENNIVSALILVLVVTFLFLGPINAIFVSLAIPFAMLISFFALQVAGITLNMVVLFSLVLALGMLVDNGIVIVENIFRHGTLGRSREDSAVIGTQEVVLPIVTSTLTTILAFFPIIFMPDIMGDFMSFIPKTVIIVLASSLLVATTVTPVFCSRFLNIKPAMVQKMATGSTTFQRLQGIYEKALRHFIDHPFKVLGGSFVFVIMGIAANGIFGKEPLFFPKIDPMVLVTSIETPQGTPIHETDKTAQTLEAIIRSVPSSLDNYQTTIGRASQERFGSFSGEGAAESHKANIRIGFKPYLEREIHSLETLPILREKFQSVIGATVKIKELSNGPPTGHSISYEITGDAYPLLGIYAAQLTDFLKTLPGLEEIDTDYEANKPELHVDIDRDRAVRFGINTQMIATTIRQAINGEKISTYRENQNEYDVTVRYQDPYRSTVQALQTLEIVKEGHRIPLSSVASVSHQASVGVIKRKNLNRTIEVWADFTPNFQHKEDVKAKVTKFVNTMKLKGGYHIGLGEGESVRNNATQFLKQAFVIALMLIFIVLVLQFNSYVQPLIILICVFLSLGGVFWGLFLSGQTFIIIMSGIGIISLAGVVVNNAIVLIDFSNRLCAQSQNIKESIIEAGRTRLRPVLLTAITTVIGLLPMALGASFDFHSLTVQIGSESSVWWRSLAWAIIYGLSFATLLTLFVVPTLVYWDYKYIKKRVD